MPAIETVAHSVPAINAATGEASTMTILVPVGPMVEPTQEAREAFEAIQGDHWKDATAVFRTTSQESADSMAQTMDFFHGGHELLRSGTGPDLRFLVWSLGYYEYGG